MVAEKGFRFGSVRVVYAESPEEIVVITVIWLW